MIELLLGWLARYPILSIEDPLAEDDPQAAVAFTRQVRGRCLVVGDDFLVRRRPGACRRPQSRLHRRAAQAQPARHADRDQGRLGRRAPFRHGRHRLGPLRRERGHHDRPSRGRLGCRPAQGRLVQPLGAHGQWNEGLRVEEALGAAARFKGRDALAAAQALV